MVTIIGFRERQNLTGEKFFSLVLQGGLEMVMSKQTGRYYATAKSASVTSTFTEEVCKELIGQKIPGSIHRVPCEPYGFIIPDTGELINLDHRWIYLKEGETMDAVVKEEEVVQASSI
jgi:hypothetical protein